MRIKPLALGLVILGAVLWGVWRVPVCSDQQVGQFRMAVCQNLAGHVWEVGRR